VTAREVLVLTTGGTIGSVESLDGLAPLEGAGRSLVRGLGTDGGIVVEELYARTSGSIGLSEMASIHKRIVEASGEGFAGVVVTHGTDTLVETAFVVRLLQGNSSFPVVFTGAMRAPGRPGSDALANLGDAVAVAKSVENFGTGVVIVFDGEVHSSLRTDKVSSTSMAAFAQSSGGPLGCVIEGRVGVWAIERFAGLAMGVDGRVSSSVALVGALPGDDGAALLACAEQCAGVVVAGLGGGHVPRQMMDAVAQVAARKPLMVTTGTTSGGSLRNTYAGPGSEQSLAAAGVITGWSLGPRKAALALSLCLGQTTDLGRIKECLTNDMEGLSE